MDAVAARRKIVRTDAQAMMMVDSVCGLVTFLKGLGLCVVVVLIVSPGCVRVRVYS